MQEQQVIKLMVQSMAEHKFKLWVSNGWILKLWLLQGYRTWNVSMYPIPCHWGVMFSVSSAGIHLVEWIRKNISYRRAQFSCVHYCVQWYDTWWMNYQQMYYWYSVMNCRTDVLKDFDNKTKVMGLNCPCVNGESINGLVSHDQTLVHIGALLFAV